MKLESMMAMPQMMQMMGMPGMGMPSMGMPGMSGMGMPMPGMNMGMGMGAPMAMVARCHMSMQMMDGGMKMMLKSDQADAAAALQAACEMMSGGMMSCTMMMNGMPMMSMNMGLMGPCRYVKMESGAAFEYRMGDKNMMSLMQACMDMMSKMIQAGMTCSIMMNGMPIAFCC